MLLKRFVERPLTRLEKWLGGPVATPAEREAVQILLHLLVEETEKTQFLKEQVGELESYLKEGTAEKISLRQAINVIASVIDRVRHHPSQARTVDENETRP